MRRLSLLFLALLLFASCRDAGTPTNPDLSVTASFDLVQSPNAVRITKLIQAIEPPPGQLNASEKRWESIQRQMAIGELDAAREQMLALADKAVDFQEKGVLLAPTDSDMPSTSAEAVAELVMRLFVFVGLGSSPAGDRYPDFYSSVFDTRDSGFGVIEPGEATVIVTQNAWAAVVVPAGAVDEPVYVTLELQDEDYCDATGPFLQAIGCWEINRVPEGDFLTELTVETCIDPNSVPEALEPNILLHKVDESSGDVTALDWADPTNIICSTFPVEEEMSMTHASTSSSMLASLGSRLARFLLPEPLEASNLTGRPPMGIGGLTGSFTDFFGAVPMSSSISGQVSLEGSPLAAVVVDLTGPATSRTVATDASGSYAFSGLPSGSYTVSISGLPDGTVFGTTSRVVTVDVGEARTGVDFAGTWATATVSGSVTVEGTGVGATVTLSGAGTASTTTDGAGSYSFSGVHLGAYTVTISDFPSDMQFTPTSHSGTLTTDGETVSVDFAGGYVRTASISGQVSVEGSSQTGVAVSATGPDGTVNTVTAGGGDYSFSSLRSGSYTVSISNLPSGTIFTPTSQVLTVGVGEDRNDVDFDGTWATGTILGSVTVEGTDIAGATVTLSGASSASMTTDGSGSYSFSGLHLGAYTVTISDFPGDVEFTSTSASGTLTTDGETVSVDFAGAYIRTSSMSGNVSADGVGVAGISVTTTGPDGARNHVTDANGNYSSSGLRSGSYTVEISNLPAGTVFGTTSQGVTVGVGEIRTDVDFDGTWATATVSGSVTVEGTGVAGVTVTLSGAGTASATTDGAGSYSFSGVHLGAYTVTISDFPSDMQFTPTSSSGTLTTDGETANVSFAGTYIRTSSISGNVSVDGVGLAGITIGLTGPDGGSFAVTDANGDYSFSGLRAGTYTVTFTGYATQTVTVGVSVALTGVDYSG